jgi:hypothetical protein
MKTAPNDPMRRGHDLRRFPTALAAAFALAPFAHSQDPIDAQPYGLPSESAPGGPRAIGLYFEASGSRMALRLEGGEPFAPGMLVFSAERAESPLPSGGTLLVGPPVAQQNGFFDADGVLVMPLENTTFDLGGDRLFVQGVQPISGCDAGMELSSGLQLFRTTTQPPATGVEPPSIDEILVEEFAGMLRAGYLEAALDLALNSKDDTLALELAGNLEVPVWPGITAGGKAGFKAAIKRVEDQVGATVYDLSIGGDVAASAGVGVGAGGLGLSGGYGGDLIWRFASTHEVARALRSMVVLQAIGPRLEITCRLLDNQIENLDRAIAAARARLDQLRTFVRARLPLRSNAIVRELQDRFDRARAERRRLADQGRRTVAVLVSWIADARRFLNGHLHGAELRKTSAFDANVGTGFGDAKANGQWQLANLGASAAVGIQHQFSLRTERAPESDAMFVEHKAAFTKSFAAAAGFGIGASVAGKRVLELSKRLQFDRDGLQREASATTVKLQFDGRLLGAVGAIVVGQAGVGGEVVAEMRLEDLLDYSADAIAILLGDDDDKAAELLRAFPIKLMVRGRYEAGLAIGYSIDLDGAFKGGVGGSAMMVDCGAGREYQGGSEGAGVRGLITAGPIGSGNVFAGRLADVEAEVARAMQR